MDFVIGIIEFLAILTFAYTGLVEARKKDMDFVGACTLALVTAFGGGTVRDLLLNRRPLYWVEHYEYTIIIFQRQTNQHDRRARTRTFQRIGRGARA